MTSRVLMPTGTQDNVDSDLTTHIVPFGGILGFGSPKLTLASGNFSGSPKELDYLQLVLLSELGNEWNHVDAKAFPGFVQTGPGHSHRRIWDSLVKESIVSFELTFPDDLRTCWMVENLFGRDDDATVTSIWTVQSSEYQTPSPNRSLNDALNALEQIAPSEKNYLEELLELPSNWDLEGGLPATKAAAMESANLIVEMHTKSQGKLEVTSLSAAIDGGVELTLEGIHGRELFLVIPSGGTTVRFVISLPTDSGSYEDTAGFLGLDKSLDLLIDELIALG